MNGMCDVCGVCDEKIKSMDISGESFEVCVFCRKPIEELEQGNPDSIQAIENLFLMDTKGKRSEKCSLKLKELLKAHGVDASAIPKAELSQHMFG